MKDLTTKGLGGVSKFFNIGKAPEVKGHEKPMGAIQMTGVYASGGELTIKPKSSFVVPQEIVDKYANVVPPKGKPTQLVIDDKYYIPDREYADAEV